MDKVQYNNQALVNAVTGEEDYSLVSVVQRQSKLLLGVKVGSFRDVIGRALRYPEKEQAIRI